MDLIRNRFPHRSEIIAVLSIAVFVCFSWTILGFLNKLSSFILAFTVAEIAGVFAFMMAFALLESLAVTGLLIVLSAILPFAWLRDGFALKGLVSIVVFALTSIISQKLLDNFPSIGMLLLAFLLPVVVIVLLLFAVRAVPKIQTILTGIQDRVLIMLFIYIPIGLLSLIMVVYQNLF